MEEEEFPEQREDEELILVAGKHWYLLILPLIKVFLGLVLVFLVLRFLGASIYFTIAFFIWTALGVTYFIINYIVWSKTRYYLTTERIIVREQKSLFSKQISEIELDNIHNVSYKISGPSSAAFKFGDVILQSYGASKALILKSVVSPQKIHQRISQIISEIRAEVKREEFDDLTPITKKPKKYIPRAPKIEEKS